MRSSDDAVKKSYFFYDSATGAKLGTFLLPRNQSASENCSLHNFNVVPLRDGDDVLVHASYQAGFRVVDFNDLANTVEVGWSDRPRSRPHRGARSAPRSAARSVATASARPTWWAQTSATRRSGTPVTWARIRRWSRARRPGWAPVAS